MLDQWIIVLPPLYVAVGVLAVWLAYRRMQASKVRILVTAFIFALFFSFGVAFGRSAVPAPTLILIVAACIEMLWTLPCAPTPDGCNAVPDGDAWILMPFLVQWALCFALVTTLRYISNALRGRTTDERSASDA